jgi:putative CocE/NonD family hydrolase
MRTIANEQWGTDALHPRVTAPVFVITGWWDRMVTSVDNYTGLVKHGPAALRGAHRLLVGPWGHQPPSYETRRRGSFDFGAPSTRSLVDVMARWFDRTLKGNDVADEPPVEVFVIGEDRWRFEQEWPPARARSAELFLHGEGHANSARGDGRLEWRPPADEPADSYRYDPRDPVMSLMEPNSHWAPYDQRPNDHRRDTLVYRTDALRTSVEIAGSVELRLWAASDASDTDWVARLTDERPDGTALPVSSGILRARYREGYAAPSRIPDAGPREYRVAMTPTCVSFQAGHRIRLDVTSSDFPNYDRNHNTGADYWSDAEFRIASQTIFHDRARPSHLVLPVVSER